MKSRDNILTEGLSGKIKQIVFRQWYGQTIIGKRPAASSVAATNAQLGIRTSFKDAVQYAKAALTNEATKLAYKAKAKPGQTPFNMAIADFFKAPVIADIDTSAYSNQAGSKISIIASDDFKVAAVRVKIEKQGTLVEEGAATQSIDGLHWLYNATVLNGTVAGNNITVTATDLPGHATSKQKTV